MTTMPDLQLRYTRAEAARETASAPHGRQLEFNRLALFWRPIIDLTDSEYASMRYQFVAPVASWLKEPETARWPLFARIAVSGLRHQVVKHAGLIEYMCEDPSDLPVELRTDRWQVLVDAIARFGNLSYKQKTLVMFQLAQLSLCRFAISLAGVVRATGEPEHDWYAHMVGRIYARYPGGFRLAVPLFEDIARTTPDPVLAVQACFQGIGHSLRNSKELEVASKFHLMGRGIVEKRLSGGWHADLAQSRFHRSIALLRLRQQRYDEIAEEIEAAHAFGDRALGAAEDDIARLVATENRRIIVESQIKAARIPQYRERVDVADRCRELLEIDPFCQYTRLIVGEGFATIGDFAEAARWYSLAGELATAAGALGWFRAAQCFDHLGDRWSALNAIAHCLELDPDVVEARRYIARALGN